MEYQKNFGISFPEWQIIENIKRHGFTITKQLNTNDVTHQNQQVRQEKPHSQYTGTAGRTQTKTMSPAPKVNKSGKAESIAPVYKQKKQSLPADRLDETFQRIHAHLDLQIIGQRNFLEGLLLAFKRPYVTGIDPIKPRNALVLFSHPGSGRKASVTKVVKRLKEEKVLKHEPISIMNLASYTTPSEFQLFLTDLYKCLYGNSDVVLFENIDKAPSNVLDAISQLTITGKYLLPSRYRVERNNLVEASGMLLQQSISEIHANGKFFVFLYEKSGENFVQTFSSKLIDALGDLIFADPYSETEIRQIAKRIMNKLKKKCETQLLLPIERDEKIIGMVAGNFTKTTGITVLEDFVFNYI